MTESKKRINCYAISTKNITGMDELLIKSISQKAEVLLF
jgi:hypothetical protein